MASATQRSSTKSETGQKPKVSLGALFEVFLTCGAVSFGGGVLGYIKEYVVDGAKMLSDDDFLTALEIAETIPGTIALNMSVIIGDTLRGVPGAIAALAGMMAPGTILVMTLAVLWQQQSHNPAVSEFLLGVAAAAVGMLGVVCIHIGRKQLSQFPDAIIVLLTFLAAGVLRAPLWAIFLTIVPLSIWLYRPAPHRAKRRPGEHIFHRGPRHHHLRH